MKKSFIYFFIGTALSYLFSLLFSTGKGFEVDLYHAIGFGTAWALAHYLDNDTFALLKKLSISILGITVLIGAGLLLFDFETAISIMMKYSIVFVGYYLLASLRKSKSLTKK